jgi:hypothetical protein
LQYLTSSLRKNSLSLSPSPSPRVQSQTEGEPTAQHPRNSVSASLFNVYSILFYSMQKRMWHSKSTKLGLSWLRGVLSLLRDFLRKLHSVQE